MKNLDNLKNRTSFITLILAILLAVSFLFVEFKFGEYDREKLLKQQIAMMLDSGFRKSIVLGNKCALEKAFSMLNQDEKEKFNQKIEDLQKELNDKKILPDFDDNSYDNLMVFLYELAVLIENKKAEPKVKKNHYLFPIQLASENNQEQEIDEFETVKSTAFQIFRLRTELSADQKIPDFIAAIFLLGKLSAKLEKECSGKYF